MYIRSIFVSILLGYTISIWAQEKVEVEIAQLEAQLDQSALIREKSLAELEQLKLSRIRYDLEQNVGLPIASLADQIVMHTAMAVGYSEQHEQATWVAHIITPDIIQGNHSRSNDFRVDSLIETGTPVTEDYWDSGFDRGHLAPSADFRWSQQALSESYYYSNMSPQRPELNREIWAELEAKLREVVIRENKALYVVTGGILTDSLPTIGVVNQVSVPEWYYKVVLDMTGPQKKGIAFLVPNHKVNEPLMQFAVSIDRVEQLTEINFFPRLTPLEDQTLEGSYDISLWLSEKEQGEALPVDIELLPRGYVNTYAAKFHEDSKIGVCGKVVSTKYHVPSGGTFLNLDRKFPNHVFSVTIWKDARTNFSYLPDEFLMDKEVCIIGKVQFNRGTPTINVDHQEQIRMLEDVLKK